MGSARIEYETPGTPSQPVPLPAQDEAIVNIALLAFLQAIWRVNSIYDTRWTAHRKAFRFVPTLHEGEQGKSFTAVTDGHLKFPHSVLKSKSAAILEVKAAHRKRQDPNKHHIYMQESAQMALWIAAEPESHWRAPIQTFTDEIAAEPEKHWRAPPQSFTNENAGKRMDDGYYRILISQDRDRIFVTLAQYKGDYLDYLQGKPATNEAFLRMFLFGPYNTFIPHHMESFGNEISELLTYAVASALEAFERTSVVEPDHRPNRVEVPGGLQVSDDVGKLEKQLSELAVSSDG